MNIDGVEYVPVSESAAFNNSDHVCIIADRGWIFEGYREGNEGGKLTNAHVVRKWDNGLGIGGLANPCNKDDYTLDYIGCIELAPNAIIAVIHLGW